MDNTIRGIALILPRKVQYDANNENIKLPYEYGVMSQNNGGGQSMA